MKGVPGLAALQIQTLNQGISASQGEFEFDFLLFYLEQRSTEKSLNPEWWTGRGIFNF